MQQKVIFVNATSLGTKGGLTILNQYLSGLEHKLKTQKIFHIADNIEANTQNGDICIIKTRK